MLNSSQCQQYSPYLQDAAYICRQGCGGPVENTSVHASTSLPCCKVYQSRTPWVSSILPPKIDNEAVVANQFPWWGLWRTSRSPPLPKVFYPDSKQPRGVYDDWQQTKQEEPFLSGAVQRYDPLIEANWALTK